MKITLWRSLIQLDIKWTHHSYICLGIFYKACLYIYIRKNTYCCLIKITARRSSFAMLGVYIFMIPIFVFFFLLKPIKQIMAIQHGHLDTWWSDWLCSNILLHINMHSVCMWDKYLKILFSLFFWGIYWCVFDWQICWSRLNMFICLLIHVLAYS